MPISNTAQEQYLPQNSPEFHTLQMLRGDRRPIAFYEGPEHIPFCITEKLTESACEGFLDSDVGPVTFTVRVPLEVLLDGTHSVVRHIEKTAFAFNAVLHSCEFRPVGACVSDFAKELSGDVLLQVSCTVSKLLANGVSR